MPLVLPGQEVKLNEPGRTFARHHHLGAYAALLIRGSCHETGDRGRHTAFAGDVLLHREFDGHGDTVGAAGAAFINISLDTPLPFAFGRVEDLDAVIRAFERSPVEGREEFLLQLREASFAGGDWPDMLARELTSEGPPSLGSWSDKHGLHPAAISRGFRRAYGVSPKRFRLEQMAANAARRIRHSSETFGAIAASCGFADQPHMNRTIADLFAVSPSRLRCLS